MEGLSDRARAAGWDDFPLFLAANRDSLSTAGYSVNRPAGGALAGATVAAYKSIAPEDIWGEGWFDVSSRYPNFDGVFLTREGPSAPAHKASDRFLIASHTMTEAELLDYAVYHNAHARLSNSQNGLTLLDETEKYYSDFEKLDAKVKARNIKSNSSSALRIEQIDKRIERQEDLVVRYANDVARISADAPSASRQERIARYTQKGEETRAKLVELQAQRASLLAAPSTGATASQSTSGGFHTGAYYAFEQNYKSILIIYAEATRQPCRPKHLVCADKLQAYNVLGPVLGPKVTSMSPPRTGIRCLIPL